QLEYEFDQLEELKQDVFDLRLELKLAKDKIKSGNFNMVQIYLDGLTPRVQKVWDKLGKKPKKLEIKLLDESLIADAVKKAKEEKKKEARAGDAAAEKDESGNGRKTEAAKNVTPAASQRGGEPAPAKSVPVRLAPSRPTAARRAPTALNASVGSTALFTSMLMQANQHLKTSNKPAAMSAYRQMADMYKTLPQEQKPLAYRHMLNINRQISMLK
ncbi:hypothetical protein KY359_02715, partial [Candidatus Woesearchaeota archaeon]|nr:hypothetical protein [Candidatus Woesearchaeota archaeon]